PSQAAAAQTEQDRLADEQSKPEAAEGFSTAKVPMLPAPAPRWMVKGGVVQRSLDAGRTWQEINVDATNWNPAESRYAVSQSVEIASSAKVSKKKVEKVAASGFVFSAVAAFTLEVWAGGKAGILYHSSDGGNSWARVVPSDSGEMLMSDISEIEVA